MDTKKKKKNHITIKIWDDRNLGDASYVYFTNTHLWVPSVTSD